MASPGCNECRIIVFYAFDDTLMIFEDIEKGPVLLQGFQYAERVSAAPSSIWTQQMDSWKRQPTETPNEFWTILTFSFFFFSVGGKLVIQHGIIPIVWAWLGRPTKKPLGLRTSSPGWGQKGMLPFLLYSEQVYRTDRTKVLILTFSVQRRKLCQNRLGQWSPMMLVGFLVFTPSQKVLISICSTYHDTPARRDRTRQFRGGIPCVRHRQCMLCRETHAAWWRC